MKTTTDYLKVYGGYKEYYRKTKAINFPGLAREATVIEMMRNEKISPLRAGELLNDLIVQDNLINGIK